MARSTQQESVERLNHVQYRPGKLFARRLGSFARRHSLTINEAAKRLAILSAYDIPARLYQPLLQLVAALGEGANLALACEQLESLQTVLIKGVMVSVLGKLRQFPQ